jgi:hypothetical protein
MEGWMEAGLYEVPIRSVIEEHYLRRKRIVMHIFPKAKLWRKTVSCANP